MAPFLVDAKKVRSIKKNNQTKQLDQCRQHHCKRRIPALLWKNEISQFSKAPESGTQASRRTVLFYLFVQLHLNSAEIRLHQNLFANIKSFHCYRLPHSASAVSMSTFYTKCSRCAAVRISAQQQVVPETKNLNCTQYNVPQLLFCTVPKYYHLSINLN